MVVQDKETEKACCFYVSDFHLEMILMPYINKKIDEDITILTERNLRESLETVTSKMNMKEEHKQKILQLNWDGSEKIKENSNIIIIGSKKYIEENNKQIENMKPVTILDCYNFEDEKNNMHDIVKNYNNTLNTLGKNVF